MTTLKVMCTERNSKRRRDVQTVLLDSYKNRTQQKSSLICVKIDDEEMEKMTLISV